LSAFSLAPVSSMLRRSASIRLTTLAGRAGALSLGAGNPACFPSLAHERQYYPFSECASKFKLIGGT
jgi:hypothetical protein